MGLFDKIKDNAKTISMKAIEATREYDETYPDEQRPATDESSTNVIEPTELQPDLVDEATPLEEPVDFLIEEEPVAEEPPVAPEEPVKEDKPEEKPVRKSKVTEISKEEYEQSKKAKKQEEDQEKAKQAAKERLAKSYTPSYKQSKGKGEEEIKVTKKEAATESKKPAAPARPGLGIIDITPQKPVTPAEKMNARERAAMAALSSQRRLNGTVPLYVASHMSFKTRVFINRIEYSGSFGKNVLPIEQVAWVKLRHAGTGVIIETTEGKRVVMVVKPADRLAFADAILKVQAMQPKKGKFKDTKTVRIDQLEQFGEGIDEIEKLAKLYDKGILSEEEFETKKKLILGI